ncbi:hypothetical protein ACJX0J_028371, partial [Zea mays]
MRSFASKVIYWQYQLYHGIILIFAAGNRRGIETLGFGKKEQEPILFQISRLT